MPKVNLEKESPLERLSEYWRGQAEYWLAQEKAWHETVLFCRKVREEIAKKREALRKPNEK